MAKQKQIDQPAKDAETLQRLAASVEKLSGEMKVLRGMLDRLQNDLAWALDQGDWHRAGPECSPGSPLHLTSMPLDALAPDWQERINRLGPDDMAKTESQPEKPSLLF